jgi:voltage-gated potassium channel Kch
MGVGMSIDMDVVWANLVLILAAAVLITLLKLVIVWLLFRATCARQDSLRAGSVLTAAGEFAFVLFPLGGALGILSEREANLLAAIAAVTMLFGPPVASITDAVLRRLARRESGEADDFTGAHGSVLLIGFGRFGQIVAQCLLAEGVDVTTIDNDPDMIQNAARFGFKVYYGDGTRLDVLRAAGAEKARLIAVCVDIRATADHIVDLVQSEFPDTKLFVRSYDRGHTLKLLARGVDYELRETYESAMTFGRQSLVGLGLDPDRASDVEEDVRKRDRARLEVQQVEGITAGADLWLLEPVPEPLRLPQRRAKPLNPEAEDIMRDTKAPS